MTSLKNKLKIAIVGASGNIGQTLLSILFEKGYHSNQVSVLASPRSVGRQLSFGEEAVLTVKPLSEFDFSAVDVVLSSAGASVSALFAPSAVSAGAIVIDNTSHFRMDPQVPLIIPEINGHLLNDFSEGIIANPNCSTIQLIMAIKPLHDAYAIHRIVCSTYQSVSGAGKEAMNELFKQTRGSYMNEVIPAHRFPKPIAFNVIPQIDSFQDDGLTKEEWKMQVETKKIMAAEIALTATCVRVPVFIGHAISANVEFHKKPEIKTIRSLLAKFKGVQVIDNLENNSYVTPVECVGEDNVFVSRIRHDPTNPQAINLWIVADNMRKGAALNAVQILERLLKSDKFITRVTEKLS